MNEIIGMQKGKIAATKLKIVGEKKTPLIEIWFSITGHNHVLPLKLWLSDKTISSGRNLGFTSSEISLEVLGNLGYIGESIQDLEYSPVDSLFKDVGEEFDLNVVVQLDRDKNPTKYHEIGYVRFFDQEREKLSKAEAERGFKNIDSAWRKKLLEMERDGEKKSSKKENHDTGNIPF